MPASRASHLAASRLSRGHRPRSLDRPPRGQRIILVRRWFARHESTNRGSFHRSSFRSRRRSTRRQCSRVLFERHAATSLGANRQLRPAQRRGLLPTHVFRLCARRASTSRGQSHRPKFPQLRGQHQTPNAPPTIRPVSPTSYGRSLLSRSQHRRGFRMRILSARHTSHHVRSTSRGSIRRLRSVATTRASPSARRTRNRHRSQSRGRSHQSRSRPAHGPRRSLSGPPIDHHANLMNSGRRSQSRLAVRTSRILSGLPTSSHAQSTSRGSSHPSKSRVLRGSRTTTQSARCTSRRGSPTSFGLNLQRSSRPRRGQSTIRGRRNSDHLVSTSCGSSHRSHSGASTPTGLSDRRTTRLASQTNSGCRGRSRLVVGTRAIQSAAHIRSRGRSTSRGSFHRLLLRSAPGSRRLRHLPRSHVRRVLPSPGAIRL